MGAFSFDQSSQQIVHLNVQDAQDAPGVHIFPYLFFYCHPYPTLVKTVIMVNHYHPLSVLLNIGVFLGVLLGFLEGFLWVFLGFSWGFLGVFFWVFSGFLGFSWVFLGFSWGFLGVFQGVFQGFSRGLS